MGMISMCKLSIMSLPHVLRKVSLSIHEELVPEPLSDTKLLRYSSLLHKWCASACNLACCYVYFKSCLGYV